MWGCVGLGLKNLWAGSGQVVIFRPVENSNTCTPVYLYTGVLVHRGASHPHDLGVAAGAGGGEELLVAVLTVDVVLLLHEADISQRHVAVVTVKLLGVPGPTQSHQERAPADDNSTRSSS